MCYGNIRSWIFYWLLVFFFREFCMELNNLAVNLQVHWVWFSEIAASFSFWFQCECTADTCTQMTATDQWIFLCAAHKQPRECSAIDYTRHTLDGAACLLNSNKYFPSRYECSNHVFEASRLLFDSWLTFPCFFSCDYSEWISKRLPLPSFLRPVGESIASSPMRSSIIVQYLMLLRYLLVLLLVKRDVSRRSEPDHFIEWRTLSASKNDKVRHLR